MDHFYRKKPVVVEAFQMTRERRTDNIDWPHWLCDAWNKNHDEPGAVFPSKFPYSDGTDELVIVTLEGLHLVNFDDWIIRGVKGELYPCKPEIFAATYDAVGQNDTSLDAQGVAWSVSVNERRIEFVAGERFVARLCDGRKLADGRTLGRAEEQELHSRLQAWIEERISTPPQGLW